MTKCLALQKFPKLTYYYHSCRNVLPVIADRPSNNRNVAFQCGGQSGVWTASVIILSIGTWVGKVGPRPADGETAHLTSPKERLETVRQVLSEVPLIDGHNDLPWNIRNFVHNQLAEFDFDKDLRQVAPWSKSAWSQTDLVRLRQGMVGGQVTIFSSLSSYHSLTLITAC